MEASAVATPEAPPEPEASHDGAAEATRSTEELFQWSTFVHVGVGAETCEHAADGACEDPRHFHAWVCVANSFQIRHIVDKARAAKARKSRALRDPTSGAYEVLEAELDDLRRDHYDKLVESVARAGVEKELPDIVHGLKDDERFEHQAHDAEEFRRLDALPEDQRDTEEYDRLREDLMAYGEELQKLIDARVAAEVERLRARPQEEVVEIERRARIEADGLESYLDTYYTWATYVGTRTTGLSAVRKFARPEDLESAAPEVTRALRETIRNLEARTVARGDAAGNS